MWERDLTHSSGVSECRAKVRDGSIITQNPGMPMHIALAQNDHVRLHNQ